jgi:hypothetical protein
MNFSRLSIGGTISKVKAVGTLASASLAASAPPNKPAAPAKKSLRRKSHLLARIIGRLKGTERGG